MPPRTLGNNPSKRDAAKTTREYTEKSHHPHRCAREFTGPTVLERKFTTRPWLEGQPCGQGMRAGFNLDPSESSSIARCFTRFPQQRRKRCTEATRPRLAESSSTNKAQDSKPIGSLNRGSERPFLGRTVDHRAFGSRVDLEGEAWVLVSTPISHRVLAHCPIATKDFPRA